MPRMSLGIVAALVLLPGSSIQAVAFGISPDVNPGQAAVEIEEDLALAPRGSIVIEGDEDFEERTEISGVRGGTGSPDDPYVISNWTIASTGSVGIQLRDTSAHVVIQDILVSGTPPATYGIHLEGAENVTIRDVHIARTSTFHTPLDDIRTGIMVEDSSNVKIERSQIAPLSTDRSRAFVIGLRVMDSTQVVTENVSIEAARTPISVQRSSALRVASSTLAEDPEELVGDTTVYLFRPENVTFEEVLFDGVGLDTEDTTNLTFRRNVIAADSGRAGEVFSNPLESGISSFGKAQSIEICGSVFKDLTFEAVAIEGANIEIRGNQFLNNTDALSIRSFSGGAEILRNEFKAVDQNLDLKSPAAQVHENSFPEDAFDSSLFVNDTNASGNWWGHPSGPSVEGESESGEGHPVHILSANVTFAPNLTAEPETGPSSVDCGGHEGPVGVQAKPNLVASARAGVHLSSNLNEKVGSVHLKAKAKVSTDAETFEVSIPEQTPSPLSEGAETRPDARGSLQDRGR